MAQDANLLVWIDMEMTGLRPETDRIIEVALVVTDAALTTVAEAPVLVVHQDDATLAGMDSWNQSTHARSGLIDKVKASTLDEAAVERRMLAFLREHVPPRVSPMCGNSICQDRRFLARWMPALEDYFHYRNLDVIDAEGIVQALAARRGESMGQAGQARGARRHLRIDRRAQLLSRALHRPEREPRRTRLERFDEILQPLWIRRAGTAHS